MNNTSESQGTATSSPSQNVTPHPTTNNTSPLSSFSEEFPAVPSPEVSISSSFGDDDDGMNVPVDDITPTLGQSPGSAVSYHGYCMQCLSCCLCTKIKVIFTTGTKTTIKTEFTT